MNGDANSQATRESRDRESQDRSAEDARLKTLVELARRLDVDIGSAAAVALGSILVSLAESLSLTFLSATGSFQQASMTQQAATVKGVCEILEQHRQGKVDSRDLGTLLMKQCSTNPSNVTFPGAEATTADAVLNALDRLAAEKGNREP